MFQAALIWMYWILPQIRDFDQSRDLAFVQLFDAQAIPDPHLEIAIRLPFS